MFGAYCDGFIQVRNGISNGRSISDRLESGQMKIKGLDPEGQPFERLVKFKGGQIVDAKLKDGRGRIVHRIVYGQFETRETPQGREITHFEQGKGKALHGLSKKWGYLFDRAGVCHSWYKRGRLSRQRFIYSNGFTAYDYRGFSKGPVVIKDPHGKIIYEVSGILDGRMMYSGTASVFSKDMKDWFLTRSPFQVKQNGKIIFKGQVQNRQKAGEWVENGQVVFYEHGVAIPKALYETPPDKLDPLTVLRLPNAQVRMALCAKIGPERIAQAGKVIHKDGAMRLYYIRGYDVNILRVQCPSTKAFYFLKVPKDAKKCEEARQWTFGVGDGIQEPIKFAVET